MVPACAAAAQAAAGVAASACSRRSASASAVAEGGRCTTQKPSSSARSFAKASTQPVKNMLASVLAIQYVELASTTIEGLMSTYR